MRLACRDMRSPRARIFRWRRTSRISMRSPRPVCRSTSRSSISTARPTRRNCKTIGESSRSSGSIGQCAASRCGDSVRLCGATRRAPIWCAKTAPSGRRCSGCVSTCATTQVVRARHRSGASSASIPRSTWWSHPVHKSRSSRRVFSGPKGLRGFAPAATSCSPTFPPTRFIDGRRATACRSSSSPPATQVATSPVYARPERTA